jgi:nitrite reductase (NADH) small subunit
MGDELQLDDIRIVVTIIDMQDPSSSTAGRVLIGHRSQLPDGTRRVVSLSNDEVGIIVHGGKIYAYRNRCFHQGGPVCEGSVIGRVQAHLSEDGKMLGESFSETEIHLVCPWHGVEYLLADGTCVTNPRVRLRRYDVLVDETDHVFLITD